MLKLVLSLLYPPPPHCSPQPITAQSPITVASLADGETVTKTRGFISSISRNHGFVESEDHTSEYFFQTSTCVLPPDGALEVGDEVQFLLRTTDEKSIADNVTLLERRTIQSMVSLHFLLFCSSLVFLTFSLIVSSSKAPRQAMWPIWFCYEK